MSPTESSRISGLADDTISVSQPVVGSSRHSIFDCPLQSHTSPTTTFVKRSSLSRPATVISRGVVSALMAGSTASQRPVRSAFAETSASAKRTVTSSFFEACPHTRIGRSRCNTILSLKNFGICTSACADMEIANAVVNTKSRFIVYSIFRICLPARRAKVLPCHTNSPVMPMGRAIFAVRRPLLSVRQSTAISPAGCGIAPDTCFSPPSDGAIRTCRNPGAALSIPSIIRKSSTLGLALHAWQSERVGSGVSAQVVNPAASWSYHGCNSSNRRSPNPVAAIAR